MPKSSKTLQKKQRRNIIQVFMGVVVLILLAVGSIAAIVLSKQNADTRQQASAPNPVWTCTSRPTFTFGDYASCRVNCETDQYNNGKCQYDAAGACALTQCDSTKVCQVNYTPEATVVCVPKKNSGESCQFDLQCNSNLCRQQPGSNVKTCIQCGTGQYFCGASQNGQYAGGCTNTGGLTCNQWLLQNYGSGEVPTNNSGTGGGGSQPTPTPVPKCTAEFKLIRKGTTGLLQEESAVMRSVRDPETNQFANLPVFKVPQNTSFTLRAKVQGENVPVRRVRFTNTKETIGDFITPNNELRDNERPYEVGFRAAALPKSGTPTGVIRANVDLRSGTTNYDNVCKAKVVIEIIQ